MVQLGAITPGESERAIAADPDSPLSSETTGRANEAIFSGNARGLYRLARPAG
jgi:hypothetical protein